MDTSAMSKKGFAHADFVYEADYSTQRAQHALSRLTAQLPGSMGNSRLHVRTSSQTPFPTQRKLGYLLGLP